MEKEQEGSKGKIVELENKLKVGDKFPGTTLFVLIHNKLGPHQEYEVGTLKTVSERNHPHVKVYKCTNDGMLYTCILGSRADYQQMFESNKQ